MAGRVITGIVADLFSWRVSIGTSGVLGMLSMLAFRSLLPRSRHFVPRRGLRLAHHRGADRASSARTAGVSGPRTHGTASPDSLRRCC
jgi:predicted MFS family arabinose efflux permease